VSGAVARHPRLPAGLLLGLALSVLSPETARAQDPCADHVPQARPQNVGRDIVGQDLDAIQERGYLTVAVYEDFPPYSWEEGGAARGIDVDVARLIAEDLGVEPRFNFVDAGETMDADLRNNVWRGAIVGGAVSNVMMRVPYDARFACRHEQVVFTGQYTTERIAIGYDEATYPEDPPVPAYFRFDTVAVENDSIADFYLSAFPGGQLRENVRRYSTMAGAMAALTDGETDAAMGPRSQIEFGLGDGQAVHAPPLPGFAVGTWTIGLAVNFRYRPLAYSVDDTIWAALADGRIAEIHAAYGVTFHPPER
jgi:ABC-type amino acid transport substrate-binding protein